MEGLLCAGYFSWVPWLYIPDPSRIGIIVLLSKLCFREARSLDWKLNFLSGKPGIVANSACFWILSLLESSSFHPMNFCHKMIIRQPLMPKDKENFLWLSVPHWVLWPLNCPCHLPVSCQFWLLSGNPQQVLVTPVGLWQMQEGDCNLTAVLSTSVRYTRGRAGNPMNSSHTVTL